MRISKANETQRPSAAPALQDGYIGLKLKAADRGLQYELSFQGNANRENSTKGTLGELRPTAFDTMRYGTGGSTGNVGTHDQGGGAGVLAAVGDRNRGVVLVDLPGAAMTAGGDAGIRTLIDMKQLAKAPAIRAFAKAAGVDLRDLSIEIEEVRLSAGFVDKNQHTLMLRLALSGGDVQQTGDFTAILSGNLAQGLDGLSLGPIEPGLRMYQGWTLPPSVKVHADRFGRTGPKNKYAA